MIVFNITDKDKNTTEHRMRNEWEDISIGQAQALGRIGTPNVLAQNWRALEADKQAFERHAKVNQMGAVQRQEAYKEWDFVNTDKTMHLLTPAKLLRLHKYWRAVLGVLTDTTKEQLKILSTDELLSLVTYSKIVNKMRQISNAYPDDYVPQIVKGFSFGGKEYAFPLDQMLINDVQLAADMDARSFVELLNLDGMGLNGLNGLIAVLGRADGEGFDEKRIVAQAKSFKEIDMATAWNVFFSLANSSLTSLKTIHRYFGAVMPKAGALKIIGMN